MNEVEFEKFIKEKYEHAEGKKLNILVKELLGNMYDCVYKMELQREIELLKKN
jgi:hypothetical protein